MKTDWNINPYEKIHVWDGLIFNFIHYRRYRNQDSLSALDLGCGVGAQLEAICDEARLYGLKTKISAIDKIPGNVDSVRKRLVRFSLDMSNIVIGDVTKKFPSGEYDLITCFELIHWLTPKQIEKLFQDVAQHLNQNGLFVLSYATKLNNALLRNHRGELDIHRSSYQDRPIHRFSHACQTNMTFCDKNYLVNLGKAIGLDPLFYAESRNQYFPTCIKLNIPLMTSRFESCETAFMGIFKTS